MRRIISVGVLVAFSCLCGVYLIFRNEIHASKKIEPDSIMQNSFINVVRDTTKIKEMPFDAEMQAEIDALDSIEHLNRTKSD